jgi:hypothetical protein
MAASKAAKTQSRDSIFFASISVPKLWNTEPLPLTVCLHTRGAPKDIPVEIVMFTEVADTSNYSTDDCSGNRAHAALRKSGRPPGGGPNTY